MNSDIEEKEEETEVVADDEWEDGFITTKRSIGLKLAARFVRSNPEFVSSAPSTTADVTDDFSLPT